MIIRGKKQVMPKVTICVVAVSLLIILPYFLRGRPFYSNMLILTFLYMALAQGWNLVAGYSGQLNFANHTFFAVGAYTSSTLLIYYNVSPWLGIWVGVLVAICIAICLGFGLLKLRGHYFAVATIAFAEIVRVVFVNWDFVGAAYGLSLPLKIPSLYYGMTSSKEVYCYVAMTLAFLATLLVWIIDRSKAGIYFKALKQDELAAEHKGIKTTHYKVGAFCINAAICAVMGTFYAQYILYLSPNSMMNMLISIQVIVVALFGGLGTVFGPVIGAIMLVPLGELTRVKLGGGGRGYDYILYGVVILIVVLYQPRGMIELIRRCRRNVQRHFRS